jgi:hypothetical protein
MAAHKLSIWRLSAQLAMVVCCALTLRFGSLVVQRDVGFVGLSIDGRREQRDSEKVAMTSNGRSYSNGAGQGGRIELKLSCAYAEESEVKYIQ